MRASAASLLVVLAALLAGCGDDEAATIAFFRNERLYLMNADGSDQRDAHVPGARATSQIYGRGRVASAPGGRRVAFAVTDEGGTHLYVAEGDGRGRREIARAADAECFDADWSPDGTLAYGVGCEFERTSMRVVDADGPGRRPLASRSAASGFWALRPRWSPDGRSILFAGSAPGRLGPWYLFIADADGGGPRQIRESAVLPNPLDGWTWSPDGKRIFFVDNALYVIDRDGRRKRSLSPDQLRVGSFSLSPDGTQIAMMGYALGGGGDWEIYLVRADGSELRRVTANLAQDGDPQWSPDGRKIVFTSERDGNPEVYVMDADGSDQTNISRSPAADAMPTWVPAD